MSTQANIRLTSEGAIDRIFETLSGGRRKPGPRTVRLADATKGAYVGPRPKRCRCGKCPACTENARWERIFQEKFADPDYYKRPLSSGGSSLNWLSAPKQ